MNTLSLNIHSLPRWAASHCAQVIYGSIFIALLAQVKIPLFFTPVPLSGQTLGVMLVAAFLGSKRGTLATLL